MTTNNEVQALLSGLAGSPAILAGFARTTPMDKLHLRRGQGFWTLAEHLSHLAGGQNMLLERMERILAEDNPEFVPFIPSEQEDPLPQVMEVERALELFRQKRDAQLALLEQASDKDWARPARHPEHEAYGLLILVRHTLMHDHWHLFRMEELLLTRDAWLTRLEG